jgi:hypothetical protein
MAKSHLLIRAGFIDGVAIAVCALTFLVTSAIANGADTDQETQAENQSDTLAFTSKGNGQYSFNTGVLQGKLGGNDRSIGLSSAVHVPSEAGLSGKFGIFSYYRVFTTNKRYGHAAWDWPSKSKLLTDGAVEIFWPEGEDRPFEMTAVYRWKDKSTLDVKTIVTPQKDLSKFEVFLASYFHESFSSPYVYVGTNPETEGKPGFLMAKKSFGKWQMFPRDQDVPEIIRDGRWQKEPSPVDWVIMPAVAAPIAVRRSNTEDLTVILMAPPDDCFAIATPYRGESHYSLYLSLFGRDIKAGETATARSRLVIAGRVSDQEILHLYRKYIEEFQGCTASGSDDGAHQRGKGSR